MISIILDVGHLLVGNKFSDLGKISSYPYLYEEIIKAIANGKNINIYVSHPVLFTWLKGILIEIIGTRPVKGESMSDWVGNAIGDMCTDFMRASLENIVLAFLTGVTVYNGIEKKYFTPDKFTHQLDDNNYAAKDILNRHAILYGVFVDYPSKENSLRPIMFYQDLTQKKMRRKN